MRIAIVSEKPHPARVFSYVARELFPTAIISYPICWTIGIYTPPLPRGLGWKDYPHIPSFDVDEFEDIHTSPRRGVCQKIQVGRPNEQGELNFELGIEPFNQSLREADQIICLMDPSSSLYHFDVARRRALGSGIAPGEARMLYALDRQTISLESKPPLCLSVPSRKT